MAVCLILVIDGYTCDVLITIIQCNEIVIKILLNDTKPPYKFC